jgi:hypothetical protein
VALLINFQRSKLQWKRVLLDPQALPDDPSGISTRTVVP